MYGHASVHYPYRKMSATGKLFILFSLLYWPAVRLLPSVLAQMDPQLLLLEAGMTAALGGYLARASYTSPSVGCHTGEGGYRIESGL